MSVLPVRREREFIRCIHDHKRVEVLHTIEDGLEDARSLTDGRVGDVGGAGADSFYSQKWRGLSNLFPIVVCTIVLISLST